MRNTMKKLKVLTCLLLSLIFILSLSLIGCGKDPCKKGHTFGSWTVTKLATCEQNGEKVRYCVIEGCGHFQKETIQKLNHIYTLVEERESTCYQEGCVSHYACSRCELVFDLEYQTKNKEDIFAEKTTHNTNGGEFVIVKPSGQNEEGLAHLRCLEFEHCGFFIPVVLEANTGSDGGGTGEWTPPA